MPNSTAVSLVVIAAAAVIAPLLSELLRRWRIPSVLFELMLGILIGPAVLGWVEVDGFIKGLSQLGLAVLFFMAGFEIDFQKLRGSPMNRALAGWSFTLVAALALAVLLAFEGVVLSGLLVGLALTTTAIGTLLPMLRDRGMLETRFGTYLTAAGAVGEFGPVLAVTLLLSAHNAGVEAILLIIFAVLAVGVAAFASRPQPPRLVEMLQRHLSTSTQLPVRIIILLIVALVVVASDLGLDNLLGAFAAGMIARMSLSHDQREALQPRLDAIGFGFLIPVFFIVSGVNFDLDALTESASTLLRVPIFLGLLLAVRGLPALFVYRGVLVRRERSALVFLQATALPMLVVITEIGLDSDRMKPSNAAALVGAGMLSVLLFPLIGFKLLGEERADEPEPSDATATPGEFGEL